MLSGMENGVPEFQRPNSRLFTSHTLLIGGCPTTVPLLLKDTLYMAQAKYHQGSKVCLCRQCIVLCVFVCVYVLCYMHRDYSVLVCLFAGNKF